MRYKDLFGKTKRDAPAELGDETLQLAFRAGLVRPAEQGYILYLPLGANVISQMQLMLRGELEEMGAQELRGLSQVNVGALAASEIQSYKQLPVYLNWHSGGMTRLHVVGITGAAAQAQEIAETFRQLASGFFEYAGIQPQIAQDIAGAQTWYVTAPVLDTEIFYSTAGGYAATRAAAAAFKPPAAPEPLLPLQAIETLHSDTIEALAQFLNVPTSRTAKAVFYASGDRILFAVVRGDLYIDEDKLKRAVGAASLRRATDEEIKRVGATPGYASPIGARGATIIIDDSIAHSPNLVAGANKDGFHFLNTNVPRDYKPDIVTDISLARAGDTSPDENGILELMRGAALGTLSAARELGATCLDPNGKTQKLLAVTLELDLGTALLAHVAAHHDAQGLVWTRALAPFDAHIVALNADKPDVAAAVQQVTDALELAGLQVLVDDRSESAGIKFNDADLLGAPLRVTIGPKTLAQNAVELKPRQGGAAQLVALDGLSTAVESWTAVP